MSTDTDNDIWSPFGNEKTQHKSALNSSILLTGVLCLSFVIAIVFVLHLCVRHIVRRHSANNVTVIPEPPQMINRPPQPDQVRPKRGLDLSTLAAIPSFMYVQRSDDTTECTVCLSAVVEGEMVKALPNCKHLFHVECIDMWLHSHSTCPVCRTGAEPQPKGKSQVTVEVREVDTAVPANCEQAVGSRASMLGSIRRILSRESSGRSLHEDPERQ